MQRNKPFCNSPKRINYPILQFIICVKIKSVMTFYKILTLAIVIALNGILYPQSIIAQNDTLRFNNKIKADTTSRIEVIAKYDGSNVLLRWGVNNSETWYDQSFKGYLIERYLIDTLLQLPLLASRDTIVIRSRSAAEFKRNILNCSKEELTVAQCLYGDLDDKIDPVMNFGSKRQDLINKYSLTMLMSDISQEAARSAGLFYKDTGIKAGESYLYRVSAINNPNVIHGVIILKTLKKNLPIPTISNISELEGKINIFWDREYHEEYFSAYFIESSTDNKSFKRLMEIPFVGGESREFSNDVFSHSIKVINYKPIFYRLIGVTPFGELSTSSKSIKAMGRDKTGPQVPEIIDITTNAQNGQYTIKWKKGLEKDISGYNIYKGYRSDGSFEKTNKKIIPSNTTIFTEKAKNNNEKMYLRLSVIDTAGNEVFSSPKLVAFRDTIAPSAPLNIKASIDSNGIVRLSWDKNKEDDMAGYFIYRANSNNHLYTNILQKPIRINNYIDTVTMKTLTEQVYYKVTAVDHNGHVSQFSESKMVKRPDKIPPMPPSITDYAVSDSSVYINWKPSRSKDVVDHQLFKSENGKAFTLVKKLKIDEIILEKNLKFGNRYTYKIIAIDDAGLISEDIAHISFIVIDKSKVVPAILTKCIIDEKNDLLLEWKPGNNKKTKYLIYIAKDESPFELLKKIDGSLKYSEKIITGGKYQFAIKAEDSKGRKSGFSNVMSIEL